MWQHEELQSSDGQCTATVSPQQAPPVTSSAALITTPATMSTTGTKKIYVIFYTTYGHIYKLVEEAVKGINSVPGSEAVVLQVRVTFECRITSSRCCDAVILRACPTGIAPVGSTNAPRTMRLRPGRD